MDSFTQAVVKHKKIIFFAFVVASVICAGLATLVPVNYNTVDYLPGDAQSTIAIKVMEEELGGELPNARVMLANVTIQDALVYKEKLAAIDGVESVSWLDDMIGLTH